MSLTATLRRVQIARTTLLLDQPFFGVLALQLRIVEDPTAGTAWTDGRSIGVSPTFVDSLTDDQLTAVIAHEVMHCACGHPWRRDARDARQWNVACDYAINPIITSAGFTLPANALHNPQYVGKSAEWIYDRLPPPNPQSSGGSGVGDGQGEVRDAPEPDPGAGDDGRPADDTLTEADWQQVTQSAARMASGRSKLPAGLARDILDQTAPRVDWRSALRRFVQQVTRADYTWTRPSVRYLASGLYLPSLRSITCGPIAVAIDTSGSIDRVLLAQFTAELRAIVDEMQPTRVDVLYCDAELQARERYEPGDSITLTAKGGGGTAFAPVFEAIAADDDPPAVLVYLTDLDGSFPAEEPEYPVLWCASGRRQSAPFGEVVSCA